MFGLLKLSLMIPLLVEISSTVVAGHRPHSAHNNAHAKHRSKRSCEQMRSCLEPFPMLVDLVEKDSAGALATLTYDVILDDVCGKEEELGECLSSTSCSVFEQSYTGFAIKDSLEYICGDGRNVLLTESGCFSRDDFEASIYQCSQVMKLETNIASLQMQAGLGDGTGFCGVFDNLLKCVHLNVERVCSTAAADFTSTLYGHTVKRLANQIGCTIQFD